MTEQALQIARQRILHPAGIDEDDIGRLLGAVMTRSVDAADVYFQYSRHESWSLEDGIVREGGHSVDQGAGIRAMSGEKTGFAYSDEIVMPALTQASRAARSIARQGQSSQVQAWKAGEAGHLYAPIDPLDTMADHDKVALLERVDKAVRAMDARIQQVIVTMAAVHDVIVVAASDGTLAADVRPLIRMNVSVIVEQDGRREQGYAGGGGRHGYDWLLEDERFLKFAREAVRQALVNLEAEDAPAGTMPVVLGPGWPGVLLHEAIGHGLEGDFNRRGTSAFAGRIGERVASPLCTVVDDGTLPGRRGSLNVDDEGTPTQCTIADRQGRTQGFYAGQAQRPSDGRRSHWQRPTGILCSSADAADDQHLHAGRTA